MPTHRQPMQAQMSTALPWLNGDDESLLFCGAAPVSRGEFRARVVALAARLPDAPTAINLCERRDHFILGFCAALLRGQTTLLPPSRAPGVLEEVAMQHPGSYRLGDADSTLPCDVRVDADPPDSDAIDARFDRALDATLPALIAFTSGSTGAPSAHPKHWGALVHTNAGNVHALADLFGDRHAHIVATVPPQHMYGMEMSVLMPMLSAYAVHPGRPFFPHDIAQALAECPAPRLLVTTPVHLRALLQAGIALPALGAIVTATAPLPVELAKDAEARFGCDVRELFGATETCVIAHRRTARETAWRLYDAVSLHPQADGTRVERPSLREPVLLADIIEQTDDGHSFELRGRQADMLEIAGKRASLADLTRRLQSIDGVRDAAMLQLDADDAGVSRLLAVVAAAPTLSDADILDALRASCDPVFLPRRIIRVDALPRNETGKLPRNALLSLLDAGWTTPRASS